MQLQGAGSAHAGDGLFDSVGDGLGLVGTVGYQDDLAGLQDGSDAHGYGVNRHLLPLVEEAGVVVDGFLRKGFDSGA